MAPPSSQDVAKQQTSLESFVRSMIKPHHGYSAVQDEKVSTEREVRRHLMARVVYLEYAHQETLKILEPWLHLYERFRHQEDPLKSKVYQQNDNTFTHQQSLKDSVLGYFYEHCLAPSFSSLNEGVRKFGVRNTTLDKLSRFLLSVLGGAERKSFDLDTLKMILRSLDAVLRIPRGNTRTQVSVQQFHIIPKIISSVVKLLGPSLEFSRHILQLVSARFTNELNVDALKDAAEFFTNFFSQFIDSTDLDKQYRETFKQALNELIPLALKRVLTDGSELTREEKMTALNAILKVVIMSFNLTNETDHCSSLFQPDSKPTSKDEMAGTDFQKTFDCIFTVALKHFPVEGVLQPLKFGGSLECDSALRELVHVIPGHLTELLGNGPEPEPLQ